MRENATDGLPHWQLDSIYPDIGSDEFRSDWEEFAAGLAALERFCDERGIGGASEGQLGHDAGATLAAALSRFLRQAELSSTLGVYLALRVSTDSFDAAAQAQLSALRALGARAGALEARFKSWLTGVDLDDAAARYPEVAAHRYPLERYRQEAEHLLGYEAEALAAELDASGGSAWAKLYNDLTSRERVRAEVRGGGEDPVDGYGVAELRTLQASADEGVRRRAYEAELDLLSRNQLAFAAAMNGVKGQVGTLARHRGWSEPLEYSLFQHGISRRSLEAMHAACHERFDEMRGYLRSKAALLGKERLAWYDLLAPIPQADAPRFGWEEAKDLVAERFATYSDELAAFARRAFDSGWVDVPPRRGKRSGAFCSPVHVRGESRVMLNFGGNLSDVFTLAHELGHAYHNDCKYRFERTVLQAPTPMTLSETASIFCETLLFDGLVERVAAAQRLAVLEQNLQHSAQLLLDIHTRFLFEAEVFHRRRDRELAAEELSEVMESAQAQVFGDALAAGERHPLMWAHKPHYYSSARSFYNFPYTFGWLFGLGLYARYLSEGAQFRRRYDELLASTGLATASDLARGFGIDIEDPGFWRGSLDVVAGRVNAFSAATSRSEGNV